MNWKYILPYWKVTYVSELSKEEILRRISNKIEPLNLLRMSMFEVDKKDCEGEVYENIFRIRAITWYKNSLRPWAEGKIIETTSGKTEIKVTFRMPYFSIFALLIMFYVGYKSIDFMPLMLVVLVIIVGLCFHSEAYSLRNKLKTILQAEIKH